VNAESSAAPLASFEAKWSKACPEFGLALKFARGAERDRQSAFACLVFEIEHAAFGIRDEQPASIKLHWWAEEFTRIDKGEARHPLTQILAPRIRDTALDTRRWQELVIGALAQRDAEPAADAGALLANYARLYAPVGAIDEALFGTNAVAVAASLGLTRALRETAALPGVLGDGKLPLPLDLLARHRLARSDLANPSAKRADALRDWFGTLASGLFALVSGEAARGEGLGVLRASMAAADARRAWQAVRAPEPLGAIQAALGSLSIPVVWSAWRAARRSPV
jgi:phytoene synthase